MKKKRQYHVKGKSGDKRMSETNIWKEPENVKWVSERGYFEERSTGARAVNSNPSLNPTNKALEKSDVIQAYVKYLSNARTGDGYNWNEYNAKRLIWDLGNTRTLASIRNAVSSYCDTMGIKLTTLRAGSAKRALTAAEKKAEYSKWVSESVLQELAVSDD